MKCSICNGKGSFKDAGKYSNCFVCGGSGSQSMYFWSDDNNERNLEGEENKLQSGKIDGRTSQKRKQRTRNTSD